MNGVLALQPVEGWEKDKAEVQNSVVFFIKDSISIVRII